jgi:Fur family zinc uptake transcriptional regulator
MNSVFPAPDHDHARCAADLIAHAEAACAASAQRLTPLRRRVLAALASSHKPVGAYEIIALLAKAGARPAPITVYRALDFLMAQGLVHRIASRNAFIACAADHKADAAVIFLICDICGAVGEAPATNVGPTFVAAKRVGFAPKTAVVELTGVCSNCRTV